MPESTPPADSLVLLSHNPKRKPTKRYKCIRTHPIALSVNFTATEYEQLNRLKLIEKLSLANIVRQAIYTVYRICPPYPSKARPIKRNL